MKSKLFHLNLRDILHSLFVAVGSMFTMAFVEAVKYIYHTLISNHNDIYSLSWNAILGAAIIGASGYLVKKLASNQEDKILGKV